MASHVTASGNATYSGPCSKCLVQVNAALTGTITVADGAGNTLAVITNPAVGNQFEFWNIAVDFEVNPSATCDLTVNTFGGRGAP